jgi:hypothetical protein
MFYLVIKDQIRGLRRRVLELREERELARQSARGAPALQPTQAFRTSPPKVCFDVGAPHSVVLGELAAAADIRLYLEELAEQRRRVEDPAAALRPLVESLALLDVLADASDRPEGEQVLLYLWTANASGAGFVERLSVLYAEGGFLGALSDTDEGGSWWGLEQKLLALSAERPERAVLVRGLAAGRFVAGEVGTHLFCPDNAALVPVQVHAWPLPEGETAEGVLGRHRQARRDWLAALARGEAAADGDPLALAPVVRIYNHTRHAFDLRSGRVFDGDPDVPALVRAALPVPAELEEKS